MKKEEKEPLLKDLCGRLIHGVMCDRLGQAKKLLSVSPNKVYCIEFDNGEYTPSNYKVEDVKPYLRPMSSMMEEEKKEILTLLVGKDAIGYFQVENNGITNTDENIQLGPKWQYHWLNFSNENISLYVDWLNAHHFDYRGLIEKGLALEAPEGMYKTES